MVVLFLLIKVLFYLGQKPVPELGSFPLSWTHLQLQHQVHSLLAQWVDVVKNQGDDDVNAVGLMGGDAVLQDMNKNTLKSCFSFPFGILVPGFHGRGPDSTQSDSPGSG